MPYPIIVDNAVRVNSQDDKEWHSSLELLRVANQIIGPGSTHGFLFGQYEPVFDAVDPCSYNTIKLHLASHRILELRLSTDQQTLYGVVEFLPNDFGNAALKWFRRDPNHLRLTPRVFLGADHMIKVLITFDLRVCRG